MQIAPDALIEQLSRLDAELGALLTPTLAADAPRAMTDAAAIALTRISESLGRRADALRVAVAAELDDRSRSERGEARLSAQLGCASSAELIARLAGVTTSTARDRIRAAGIISTSTGLTGDTLPAPFPAIRAAFTEGRIGLDTVAAIAGALGPLAARCHPDALAAAETELVEAAAGTGEGMAPPCTPDETRMQAKVWALVLDPDGTLPDYERAMRRRALTLGRTRDGLIPIHGALLPDVAEQLSRLFDAHLSPRVDDRTPDPLGVGAARGPHFEIRDDPGCVVPHDPRSRAQKQHDVLASVLGVAARAADSPSIGGAPPTLLVTIAASDLEEENGVAYIDGTEATLPSFVARHIACCGGIQRLVFGDDGRILELGGPQRVFSAAQRRAITARDGGCVIAGCGVPASWCEIHHVTEHSRHGPTHTDNGVALCWYHHRTLETNGWRVRMVDGVPETKAPHYIDPYGMWRPVRGSLGRERERLRRRRNG